MDFSILEKEPDEKILKIEDELHDVLPGYEFSDYNVTCEEAK